MPCPSHDTDHADLLRRSRMRVTAARVAILDILCHAERAVDAQEVAERLRAATPRAQRARSGVKTDRVTVYRTLNALARAGIAHRVHAGDRVWRYALAGAGSEGGGAGHDAHASPVAAERAAGPASHEHGHPHFVCDSCGRVECLDELSVVLRSARPGASPAKVRRERRITRQDVMLHGTCNRCRPE